MDLIKDTKLDKTYINSLANKWIAKVENGDADVLEAYTNIKAIAEAAKAALKKLEEQASVKLIEYKNSKDIHSASLTYSDARRSFDYSNVTAHVELKKKLEAIEQIAKSIKTPMVDPETGEVIEPAMEVYSKSSISVKFK